jgi:hypothetical protein
VLARLTVDDTSFDRTSDQLGGAVLLDVETLGDSPDWRTQRAQRLEYQEKLVLLRFETHLERSGLAEREKVPDLVPKLGQGAVLVGSKVGWSAHELRRSTIHTPRPLIARLARVSDLEYVVRRYILNDRSSALRSAAPALLPTLHASVDGRGTTAAMR